MKRFLRHFIIPISLIVILSICVAVLYLRSDPALKNVIKRTDTYTTQRVFDKAGILSSSQKAQLKELIDQYEKEIKSDLIIYTINQPLAQYAYHNDYLAVMKKLADNIYDQTPFGYDVTDRSGALLLVNFYRQPNGKRYFYMSTMGYAKKRIHGGETAITQHSLTDIGSAPFTSLKDYLKKTRRAIKYGFIAPKNTVLIVLIILVIISSMLHFWYAFYQRKAQDLTTAQTYVDGGKGKMLGYDNTFTHKNVTKRYDPPPKNNGGGNRGGGGGGSHGGGGGSF